MAKKGDQKKKDLKRLTKNMKIRVSCAFFVFFCQVVFKHAEAIFVPLILLAYTPNYFEKWSNLSGPNIRWNGWRFAINDLPVFHTLLSHYLSRAVLEHWAFFSANFQFLLFLLKLSQCFFRSFEKVATEIGLCIFHRFTLKRFCSVWVCLARKVNGHCRRHPFGVDFT